MKRALQASQSDLVYYAGELKSMLDGRLRLPGLLIVAWGLMVTSHGRAQPQRVILPGLVPTATKQLSPLGNLPTTNALYLAIALPLRNQGELSSLLRQLYSPGNSNFHRFLTPDEFASRFGPTRQQYERVIRFAQTNGLMVASQHSNRLVLDVQGGVASVERAFDVRLRRYRHPTEGRDFFAPDRDPTVPADLPVCDVWGLSDYYRPTPLARPMDTSKIVPLNNNGAGPSGSYRGRDFRNAYAPGTGLSGVGQTVAVVEFDGYYPGDITSYEAACGYTNVPLQDVLLDGVSGTPGYSGTANAVAEVSLDIELVIAMAPGLSKVMVYEGANPYDVLNGIATDNQAKQISCSWAWSVGPTYNWGHPGTRTLDSQLQQMAAQGQSFFQASGDSDAYTGPQAISSSSGPIPVDSIHVTSVGGTTLTMSGVGASWASETVWNWGNNTGSGGGISPNYTIPYWQTNVAMSANNGSPLYRNIPDVALTADAVNVVYNNGTSEIFGGTSCAAPLWAGFTAMVNQQASAAGGTPVGFLNPALYAIANSPNYDACFHDVTTGNNIGNNTPGLFNAVAHYDLATGLGTPNGTNLINALAPSTAPFFVSQPSSLTVTNGAGVTFSATAGGQLPLTYRWLFNGTNLPAGGNFSGTTSNVLTITSAALSNAGNYQLVVTNTSGSATSAVATLTVTFPPSFLTQPASEIVAAGGDASFSATVSGATPMAYQWRQNGTNLINGGKVSGATSNYLALAGVTVASAGNYNLVAANVYGAATSSVAVLTVAQPPSITVPPLAQTVQCGSNALFTVSATGTPPLSYQWTLDNSAVAGATTTDLLLTDVHLPDHIIAVLVTNLYGKATSSVALAVQDTMPPAITLNGDTQLYLELGSTFADPGATAFDACAGTVPVSVSGTVNTNAVGTNALLYTAADANGNTNSVTRTVILRDTTPPTVQWSFTNLVLVADTSCAAALTDVTGTNYILATDLSEPLSITQSPSNGTLLGAGTNTVILTVADTYGNSTRSTNTVIVQDETPPLIALNGDSSLSVELGSTFTDPGATASDACEGTVPVSVSGTVNTAVVGTNTLLYTASDSQGNTSTAIRTVLVSDTAPPTIQWSFTNLVLAADGNCGAVLPDLTGTNGILATDLSEPLTITQSPTNGTVLGLGTTTVVLTVVDAYGNTAYSTNTVMVQDQTPPLITLNGDSSLSVELGRTFTDPGVSASDACEGTVPVSVSGTVNTAVLGTNTLLYTASDSQGNTSTATRTVLVSDTVPPTIQWSFTNLVLAADGNCGAVLPDLTGTNGILAADLSDALTITQNPTNGTVLGLGTTTVVLTVADASGNMAYSTNEVIVEDQTPPAILTQPQSQTNAAGTDASFSVVSTACTPLSYQWFFNQAALNAATNSTLTLSNVTSSGSGDYFVICTGSGGSSTSSVATLAVDRHPSTVTLTSSENPAGFMDILTFTAAVTPTNATGIVQFFTNGVSLGSQPLLAGQPFTAGISSLPRGTNIITAVYSGDTSDLPSTNTLAQLVTNHPPTGADAYYLRPSGMPLDIALTNLAQYWSDADGDPVTCIGATVSTNGVTVTNNTGTLVYWNTNNVADEFACAITDGWGGTNFQTVQITVVTAAISGVTGTNGAITLQLTGAAGYTYVLQATTDLVPAEWLPIATNTLQMDGFWEFTEPQATNFQHRFYRLQVQP